MEKIKDGKELAAVLSSFLNSYGSAAQKDAIDAMLKDHRSLQQATMRFFMMFVENMANNSHDGRNQASVNLAKLIMALPVRDRALPLI